MANATCTQAESDQKTRKRGSQCCSFSKNMKLPTRKGGGVGVEPSAVGCWKASGGSRLMGERSLKAEAHLCVGGSMKGGKDRCEAGQQKGQTQEAQAASEQGGCQQCYGWRFENGKPMAMSDCHSTCSFPGGGSPEAP